MKESVADVEAPVFMCEYIGNGGNVQREKQLYHLFLKEYTYDFYVYRIYLAKMTHFCVYLISPNVWAYSSNAPS